MMASFIGSDQELLCPICAGPYNVPRKLPGCIHSFCETCILTFIQNLKKEENLGEEFDCPVCRLPSKSPEEDNITIDWVQSLDKDETLETKLEKEQEYDSRWCSQCRYINKFIKSKVYCASCQESFCESCSETLHSFQINSRHVLIDVTLDGENENIHEQAVDLVQKFLSCPGHSKRSVEFFCPNEEKFCCATCATTNHQQCENIKPLQELTENSTEHGQDENNSVAVLLGSLQKLTGHLQTVINFIKERDAETKKSPEKIEAEFQDIREKVIHLLDVAQEQILQDSRAHAKALSIKNLDKIQQLEDTDANITADMTTIAYVLNNLIGKLPTHSAVVCFKKTKLMLQNLERKIVQASSVLRTGEVLLRKEEVFDTILNLGPNETDQIVSVHTSPKNYPLPRLDGTFLLRDGKIEMVAEKTVFQEYPENQFISITFLGDNKMFVTDMNNGVCLLLDADSQPVDSINFQDSNAYQNTEKYFIFSACMANGLIAISLYEEKKICFISFGKKLEKTGEILCKHKPADIHGLGNGDLGVLWDVPVAFSMITVCGGSYREKHYFRIVVERSSVIHKPYMAVDESRLHVIKAHTEGTDSEMKGVIVCYDFNGNMVYEYSHPELRDPKGMAFDSDGNVFICEHAHGMIYILTPEGLLVRTIKEECPEHPLGIGFSKTANEFAVSDNNDKLVFFSIKPP